MLLVYSMRYANVRGSLARLSDCIRNVCLFFGARFGSKADMCAAIRLMVREFRFAYFERLPILNLAIRVVASSSTV